MFRGKKLTIVIDNSEQQIAKFSDKLSEQFHYSSKKKLHTLSKLLACAPNGRIYFLSSSYAGSQSDLQIYYYQENRVHKYLDEEEHVGADGGKCQIWLLLLLWS